MRHRGFVAVICAAVLLLGIGGCKGKKLTWPVRGGGEVICAMDGYAGHTGVDIGGKKNAKILAAADGIVSETDPDGGGPYGIMILIDHGDGMQTRYAHLSRAGVSPGDEVKAGKAIGRMGSSGNATCVHLHFEVMIDGVFVDPMDYLKTK